MNMKLEVDRQTSLVLLVVRLERCEKLENANSRSHSLTRAIARVNISYEDALSF